MPSIEINLNDFCSLLGKKMSAEQLNEIISFAKAELDNAENEKALKIDIKDVNRPDLWSTEGLARELKARLGLKKGLQNYSAKKSGLQIIVDSNVKEVRPLIVGCIAKNVSVTNDLLIQLIQLQEKICLTYGRKRKEAAIGIYDFDKIKWPVHYKAFKGNELKFAPLEFEKKMTLNEIIELHPKGKEYGYLLEGKKTFPIVIDSNNEVCSMPPIINSNYTGKVTEKTKNLFIEVTGFDLEIISTSLNVIACALADRNVKIESLDVVYGNKKIESPDFKAKKIELDLKMAERICGEKINESKLKELLEKSAMNYSLKENKATVEFPCYRNDVLHSIDIVEDLLISFDFNKLTPMIPKLVTKSGESRQARYNELVKDCCIGLGLQEIATFTLTSKEKQESKMNLQKQEFVEIANPMSSNSQIFRKSLLPEALDFLSKNKSAHLPINLFEIGKVLELNPKNATKVNERNCLCICLQNTSLSFNEIKSVLVKLAEMLELKIELSEIKHSSFIEGRTALILINGKKSGIIGEINPLVLEKFDLENPIACLEIELNAD